MKYDSMVDELKAKDIAAALSSGQHEGNVILTVEGIGQQEIKIVSSASNIRGLVRFVICPACNRQVRVLYYLPDKTRFLCRTCSELRYLTQCDRAYRRTPYQRKKPEKEDKLTKKNRQRESALKIAAKLKNGVSEVDDDALQKEVKALRRIMEKIAKLTKEKKQKLY